MNKGERMFYGRARRIDLAKKIGFVVGVALVIFISISFLSSKITFFDKDVEFGQLTKYLEGKGYACRSLQNSGGTCNNTNNKGTSYTFTRYDTGFSYSVSSDSYYIEIKHLNDIDSMLFRTNINALSGYKEKIYYCTTTKSVVGDLNGCSSSGEVLDSDVYLGVVEKAIYDVNGILRGSGYEYDAIVNDYSWIKK